MMDRTYIESDDWFDCPCMVTVVRDEFEETSPLRRPALPASTNPAVPYVPPTGPRVVVVSEAELTAHMRSLGMVS